MDITRNMIDPNKLIFDLHGHNITETCWMMQERRRQLDKTINNEIGYFHQKLLGSVKGWSNIDDDLFRVMK